MRETGIDSMKYRTSSHLAGIDVETIATEKGSCILTIKETFYDKLNVNGKMLDGYYIDFEEPVKQMKCNSTNRKSIAKMLIAQGKTAVESRNIGNWAGMRIELYFEPSVVMKGETVGGIRIKENLIVTAPLDTTSAIETLNKCTTLEQLTETWKILNADEKKSPAVLAKATEIKSKLL